MRAISLGLLSLLAAGCVTTKVVSPTPPVQREVLTFDPVLITPGPTAEVDLASYNEEELFALGTSSYAAEDYDKAARCFGRLADAYPQSSHRRDALYNAGLALEHLKKFDEALERFKPLADPRAGQGDALDASFRLAECHYHLDQYPPAIEILTTISLRDDVPFQSKLEAKVQRGICEIENKDLDTAEKDLREALRWWGEKKDSEKLDEYFPGQAQFFLGEIYRTYFEAVELDPDLGETKLGKALEYKCELLLSAQGHYLRAIRIGDGQWATSAGFRIGALYEQLYDNMLNAKVPKEFNAEQGEVYREELRKKVRVLVTKSMGIYERTLAAAERIGVDNTFVQKTKQSLERMKQILVDDAEKESAKVPVESGKSKSKPSSGLLPSESGSHPS